MKRIKKVMEKLISEYRVELFRGGKFFPVEKLKITGQIITQWQLVTNTHFYGRIDMNYYSRNTGTKFANK